MGFEYTNNNINDIAEKCHKMMGLSSPLKNLRTALIQAENVVALV